MEGSKPRRLRCSVQNYDWGRTGGESTVARLYSRNSAKEIEPERRYAEFWMGTHESGPSFVEQDESCESESVTLKSWIADNPKVLGEKVLEKWGRDLPFLFKVLSVSKALSMQAHPDKELARVLHKTQPGLYKDSNHKPEMALAITEFKALCGFISLQELKEVVGSVPEIVELVGNEDANKLLDFKEEDGIDKLKPMLQLIFTKIMSADKGTVSDLVSKMNSRLNLESKVRLLTEKEQLVLVLEKQYPADVGVITSFFFNYVKLNPGEALYLGANEPHAYISGECIECMATSDNVVRAGLTPKYRDVETLCSMLTYNLGFPEILHGIPLNPYISRYIPPFDEFEVDHCSLPLGESVVFPALLSPSIFVVVHGAGSIQTGSSSYREMIMEGHVLFVPVEMEISLTANANEALQLYRAGVNSSFFE